MALGQDDVTDMDAKAALGVAKDAIPEISDGENLRVGGDHALGTQVGIISDDNVPEPVVGELIACSERHIAVLRRTPDLGDVVVHFPRYGYLIRAA